MPNREKACYPTEEERVRAYNALREETERPAREAAQAEYWRQEAARKAALEREDEEKKQREADARAEREAQAQAWRARTEAEESKKAAAAAEVHKMALDKANAVPAISAIICDIESGITDLRQQLDREKRVSALGGATNLADRHQIASQIVDDTDELAGWRAALKRLGAERLPCKSVAGITKCKQSDMRECDDASRGPAVVWDKELDTLWGSDKPHPAR